LDVQGAEAPGVQSNSEPAATLDGGSGAPRGIPVFGAAYPRVTPPFAAQGAPEGDTPARLACLRHAARVRPEPGSNSPSENVFPACAGSFSEPTGLAKRPYLPGFQGSVPHLPPLQQVHAPTHLSCVSSAGLIIPHPRRVCQGHSPLRTQVLGSQGIASAPKSRPCYTEPPSLYSYSWFISQLD
jgi:hypothetical protein